MPIGSARPLISATLIGDPGEQCKWCARLGCMCACRENARIDRRIGRGEMHHHSRATRSRTAASPTTTRKCEVGSIRKRKRESARVQRTNDGMVGQNERWSCRANRDAKQQPSWLQTRARYSSSNRTHPVKISPPTSQDVVDFPWCVETMATSAMMMMPQRPTVVSRVAAR